MNFQMMIINSAAVVEDKPNPYRSPKGEERKSGRRSLVLHLFGSIRTIRRAHRLRSPGFLIRQFLLHPFYPPSLDGEVGVISKKLIHHLCSNRRMDLPLLFLCHALFHN